MRKRSICLVCFSVFVWGVITYFLFLDKPVGRPYKNALSNRIDRLRGKIQQKIADNQRLLKLIIEQGKKRYEEESRIISVPSEVSLSPEDEGKVRPGAKPKTEEEIQREKLQRLAEKKTLEDGSPIIAVLVFSCDRVSVKTCLDKLIDTRPNAEQFPIIVSQDCKHQATANIIKSYGDKVVHIQQPDQSDIDIPITEKKFKGYFKIARHYGWALNQVFFTFGFNTAIIVEDDLEVAPDFYEYFLGTYPILVADKSLWCVSAWNDNGKAHLIDQNASDLLYRTDFFPGLGWMLTKDLWSELSPKWTKAYWDDWIRRPEHRKERACIRPEISRTKTFGKVGVSNGQFYDMHLKFIELNKKSVPFTTMNLTYLLRDNYDKHFVDEVYKSPLITLEELESGVIKTSGPVRISYSSQQVFKNTTKALTLMDDFRSGVPRTSYRGIITFFYKNRRVHLAPNTNWNGYNISWS